MVVAYIDSLPVPRIDDVATAFARHIAGDLAYPALKFRSNFAYFPRTSSMSEEQATTRSELLSLTTQIVTAHLSNNPSSGTDVPGLIQAVFDTLNDLAATKSRLRR